jgi:uncharacterized protein
MIDASPVIRQIAPPQPGMDFWALRQKGIERIIELGSGVWTDFNVHDPGITILEVLCYAINDLSYRTNLPIQDLLADQSGRFALPGVPLAPEILSCYPVTAFDWRKLLIDIDGVANAWIVKTTTGEVPFRIDQNEVPHLLKIDAPHLALNGLFKVLIDLDEEAFPAGCKKHDVMKLVEDTLHHYRNLCEDIVDIAAVKEQPIGICAHIELNEDALPEQVLAEVCYAIQQYLTPSIRFYGLEEMLEKRGTRSLDAVFEGPLLANGFIDDAELANSELRTEVACSDLFHIIRDVAGVQAVKSIQVKINNLWQDWQDALPAAERPKKLVLSLEKSSFTLTRYGTKIGYDAAEVADNWAIMDWTRRPAGAGDRMAVTYPQATARPDLGDYFSIQNDFPHTYHVGAEGLKDNASRLRHAQVKQLKAYLLFFDQILANYLVQLTEVKNLFHNDQAGAIHTAGADLSQQIPFIESVLGEGYADFVAQGSDTAESQLRQRHALLDHLLARFGESFSDYTLTLWYDDPDTNATTQDFLTRQERQLADKAHLLQVGPLLHAQRGKGFNYRARRFEQDQYGTQSLPDIWNTDNVEGLKKRVCALLGIKDFSRHTLTCPPSYDINFWIESQTNQPAKGKGAVAKMQPGTKRYLFDLKNAAGITLLEAYPGSPTDAANRAAAKMLQGVLTNIGNYAILKLEALWTANKVLDIAEFNAHPLVVNSHFLLQYEPVQKQNYLYVCDDERKFLARSTEGIALNTTDDLKNCLTLLKATLFNEHCNSDGFHIVEHILLRPKVANCIGPNEPALMLKDCCKSTEETLVYINDPYSFWITVVAPQNWKRLRGEYPFVPGAFKKNNNHRYFERLVRENTPSHIGVRICWLDNDTLYQFEKAYGTWLTELNEPVTDSCDLDKSTETLVDILNRLSCPCCDDEPERIEPCKNPVPAPGDPVTGPTNPANGPTNPTLPPTPTDGRRLTADPKKKSKK